MELLLLFFNIMYTTSLIGFLSFLVYLCDILVIKPGKLRTNLRNQGITGPSLLWLGNFRDLMKKPTISKAAQNNEQIISHDVSDVFPYLKKWQQQYGSVFQFSLGSFPVLYINDPQLVKEMCTITSPDFGKPSYLRHHTRSLLGNGILTANGVIWAHAKKIISPTLYMEKVKEMTNIYVESSLSIVNSWIHKIECEGGVADIKVDPYMRIFSGDVIAKACFGSDYSKGEEIFAKLRALQEIMSANIVLTSIPGLRYLPTKSNKAMQRLEKEIREMILKLINERSTKDGTTDDLLQMILQEAKNSELTSDEIDHFIVDNCKNIYFAGYGSSAVTMGWMLLLLALYPEWQTRLRDEIFEVCGDQLPDNDLLPKMKILTMVINETLRLYPPAPILGRQVFGDMKIGGINIPKGVSVWSFLPTMHLDPELWGPDADKFNPLRFANGVNGACKAPSVFMPFGVGHRICLGQLFAMTELKVILALLVSNFSFAVSPKYKHSPIFKLIVEAEYGINVVVRRV